MSKKASSPSRSSKKRSTRADKRRTCVISASTPFETLCGSPEQINAAILLAEELMRKSVAATLDFEDIERAEDAIRFSRGEIQRIETQFDALVKTPAAPGLKVPAGF